jgi:Major Facilitator Superfamily
VTGSTRARRSACFFFAGYAVSQIGYAMSLFAFPVLMLHMTGSTSLTALVTAFEALPYLFFGLIAGAIADRGRLFRILCLSDIWAAAALAIAGILMLRSGLTPGALLACAAAAATATTFRDSAVFGSLRVLADQTGLANGASIMQITGAAAAVTGPLIAGLLVSHHAAAVVLFIDSATYLVAVGGYSAIRRQIRTRQSAARGPIRADIRTGWRELWSQPALRHVTLLVGAVSVSGGAVVALITPLTVHMLSISATSPTVAVVVMAGNIGGLLGGILLTPLAKFLGPGRLAMLAAGLLCAASIGLPATGLLALLAGTYLAWQALFVLLITNGIAVRLKVARAEVVSRVSMTARMVAWGAQPVGGLLAALLGSGLGPGPTMLILAIPAAAATAVGIWLHTASVISRATSQLANPAASEGLHVAAGPD